ncbi:MAG: RHS repeat-associated core domain-containing protein [Planctomycetota bacterium]|nr:MAG: RHS repeat-associated core domain-containing protein [Planctomycetota bacterium]
MTKFLPAQAQGAVVLLVSLQYQTDAAGATETAFTTEPSTYGSLISHRKAGASTTYHFDALGSTRALTDASETVVERYNYTAFGTLLGSPTLLTPFQWGGMVGYYWDADLATQYIRARHYQPAIARWISLDPIGFAGGDANLFRYVGNSPTSGATGMRLKLTAAAYGRWQLAITGSALTYSALARINEARNGQLLSHDPLEHSGGMMSGMDPSGESSLLPIQVRWRVPIIHGFPWFEHPSQQMPGNTQCFLTLTSGCYCRECSTPECKMGKSIFCFLNMHCVITINTKLIDTMRHNGIRVSVEGARRS